MNIALTIAGSDPSGGAGIQLDLRVFNRLGVHGISVITALTAQNTCTVKDILKVEPFFIKQQLQTILSDILPDAVKTGMLFSADAVVEVSNVIKEYGLKNLVIDPVLISSTGTPLMQDGLIEALKEYLIPLAQVITPNISEASAISGIPIHNETDMVEAASALIGLGSKNVIITGGDMVNSANDLLYDGSQLYKTSLDKIEGEHHGTGCALTAAIAACLAKGMSIIESFETAKSFVHQSIKDSRLVGKGMRLLNV